MRASPWLSVASVENGLRDSDYDNLDACYVSPAIAASARLRRVTSDEGKQIVGRSDRNDYSGIAFPYYWPGEDRPRAERLRLDNPPQEYRNGKLAAKHKYLSAPGWVNRLYFHPQTDPSALMNTTFPIVFLEGEKKALAMFRLAWEGKGDSSEYPLFLAVGISGVYGWQGRIGKTLSPTGARVDEKGPIPDLDRVAWNSRPVYILFDSNTANNPRVAAARLALAKELTSRDAEVWLVDLPLEPGVNGIDDYLGRHGPAAGLDLLETKQRFDPLTELARLPNTDFGNETAFSILFGTEYLYNRTTCTWLRWNGVFWGRDSTGAADRAMIEVSRARLQATAALADEKERRAATAAALRLQNVRYRQAALQSATSNTAFSRGVEEFDQRDLLLACANGVIDLQSATFRAGLRNDMMTQSTTVAWIPEATCDHWLGFLQEVFPGRPEMLTFIQRAIGYSLTGLTREEVFFILYGSGRNGKGTFLRILQELLGDYGATAEFSTLVADRSRAGAPRNDIAALVGKRFVSAQESGEGARFDEALVKTLTGGDLITARFLHREFFTFRPTWKIWLATNHRPEIRGSDTGIWSRPRLIPFTVSFEGRENRNLKAELLRPLHLSGILRWAVEGCRDYLEHGLPYPQEVIEATAQYRADSDAIGRFIDECCVIGECVTARATPLYQAYREWVKQSGEAEMTGTAFGRRITERGFAKESDRHGKIYRGIGVRCEQTRGHSDE